MEYKIVLRPVFGRVHFPQLRQILIFSLFNLSDHQRQKKEWVSPNFSHGFWDTFRFDVSVIFDDLDLDQDPEGQIGYCLVNQAECNSIKPLTKALDEVLDRIGIEQPDVSYIESPLWDRVIETAKTALEVFMENERAAQKLNPIPWQGEEDWALDLHPEEKEKL